MPLMTPPRRAMITSKILATRNEFLQYNFRTILESKHCNVRITVMNTKLHESFMLSHTLEVAVFVPSGPSTRRLKSKTEIEREVPQKVRALKVAQQTEALVLVQVNLNTCQKRCI